MGEWVNNSAFQMVENTGLVGWYSRCGGEFILEKQNYNCCFWFVNTDKVQVVEIRPWGLLSNMD